MEQLLCRNFKSLKGQQNLIWAKNTLHGETYKRLKHDTLLSAHPAKHSSKSPPGVSLLLSMKISGILHDTSIWPWHLFQHLATEFAIHSAQKVGAMKGNCLSPQTNCLEHTHTLPFSNMNTLQSPTMGKHQLSQVLRHLPLCNRQTDMQSQHSLLRHHCFPPLPFFPGPSLMSPFNIHIAMSSGGLFPGYTSLTSKCYLTLAPPSLPRSNICLPWLPSLWFLGAPVKILSHSTLGDALSLSSLKLLWNLLGCCPRSPLSLLTLLTVSF